MRRLDRYIFREILVPGLIALVALTFIVFSRRAGQLLDIIVRQSPTVAEIWAVIVTLLPAVLVVTIPMGVLMGILTGFSRLSSDSEAIAMRAAGISMRRILRPVLVFAILAWALTQALTVWIVPQTAATVRTRVAQLTLKTGAIELNPRVFYERPGWPWKLWFAEFKSGDGIEMQKIILIHTMDPDQPEFTFAQSGTITLTNSNQSVQLSLHNSSKHEVCRIPSPETEETSNCNPDAYETISVPGSNTLSIDLEPRDDTPSAPPVSEAPTMDLWAHMRAGTASLEETVEFHQRLALPFACIAFALVGLPLGVSTNRGGRSTGLVLSLILMFAYYMALVGGTRATGAGGLSPILGAWLPNVGFLILGMILLARSDRQHENWLIASMARATQSVKRRFSSLKPRSLDLSGVAYTPVRFRLFKILDVYVLRGFLFFFAIVLGVFASLFIVVTLFELLPFIISNKITADIVITYFIFLLPQIFYWVMPLAVLLAILINLGTLTKSNEILAVKASAVSLYRMSLPIILVAAILSGVVYLMQDYVLPWTNQKQDEYHNVIKDRAPQTYNDPYRKLMMGSGNRLYHYTFFDPNINTFANLSILRLDPITNQVQERLFAKRASWTGGNWMLEEGWHRRFPEDGKRIYLETFTQKPLYEMDPPAYFNREVREADQMNYSELKLYVEDLRRSGFDVGRLTVDLYRKLSFPMVSFIMALIGVPFSYKTGKKGAFYGIGFCLAVGIIYWLTFELFGKLGGINQLSPFVAAWFPNIIFGASGFWMMLRMKT